MKYLSILYKTALNDTSDYLKRDRESTKFPSYLIDARSLKLGFVDLGPLPKEERTKLSEAVSDLFLYEPETDKSFRDLVKRLTPYMVSIKGFENPEAGLWISTETDKCILGDSDTGPFTSFEVWAGWQGPNPIEPLLLETQSFEEAKKEALKPD